jgi:hypothetical protein
VTDSLSPRLPRGRLLRTTLLLATGTVAVVALTACASGSNPGSSPSAASPSTSSPSATATPSPTETPTPTPTPTVAPAGTPIALTCEQVVTLDDVYAFNPNYGSAPGFEATSAWATKAVEFQGLDCGLLNQTSGEIIEYSVAQPNDVLMTQLKNEAVSTSLIVPTYGTPPAVEGYFSTTDGVGLVQVFTPTYWITFSSRVFGEPGDSEKIVTAAVANLQ